MAAGRERRPFLFALRRRTPGPFSNCSSFEIAPTSESRSSGSPTLSALAVVNSLSVNSSAIDFCRSSRLPATQTCPEFLNMPLTLPSTAASISGTSANTMFGRFAAELQIHSFYIGPGRVFEQAPADRSRTRKHQYVNIHMQRQRFAGYGAAAGYDVQYAFW